MSKRYVVREVKEAREELKKPKRRYVEKAEKPEKGGKAEPAGKQGRTETNIASVSNLRFSTPLKESKSLPSTDGSSNMGEDSEVRDTLSPTHIHRNGKCSSDRISEDSQWEVEQQAPRWELQSMKEGTRTAYLIKKSWRHNG